MRVTSGVLTSTACGAVFGTATSLVNNVPGMLEEVGQAHSQDSAATWTAIFISLILDSGWAWATVAFLLGWHSGNHRRPLKAALAGAAGLIAATVAYYATDLMFGIDAYWPTVIYWFVRAVVFGLLLGTAGALARRPGATGLLATLVVPIGAAMNIVLLPLRNGLPGESSAAGWAQATVWAVAAAGAAFAVLRFIRSQIRGRSTLGSETDVGAAPVSADPRIAAWERVRFDPRRRRSAPRACTASSHTAADSRTPAGQTHEDSCVKAIYPDNGDGDREAVPGLRPEPEGAADVTSLTLEVDGEAFALSPNEFGGTDYTWLSGPNPGYGFGVSPTPNLSTNEHIENIRDFLAHVDPTTGYIEDD